MALPTPFNPRENLPPAPWRPLLTTHLTKPPKSNLQFTLATATLDPHRCSNPIPHARTVGFRGFFPDLELSDPAIEVLQRTGGLNPDVFESDLISFTTDQRMEKVRDLDAGDNGHGGGAVEAVFWIREAMCQWRVRGRGIILGSCSGEGEKEEKARREVAQWMRRKTTSPSGSGSGSGSAEKEKEWTWDRMVDTYFANHSPILRGSFKAPAPGQVRGALPPDSELGIGLKVDDIYDSVARRNFRVVVIVPDMVERLDLNDYEKPMRTRWFLNEGGNGWNEAEVWP